METAEFDGASAFGGDAIVDGEVAGDRSEDSGVGAGGELTSEVDGEGEISGEVTDGDGAIEGDGVGETLRGGD